MMIKQLGKSQVSYDPITGEYKWVVCCKKPWLIGERADRPVPNGYMYIRAGGESHSASRLAVELCTGEKVPYEFVVDHINNDKQDNRIENLRVVTQAENLARTTRPLGQSGVRGIRIYNRPTGNGFIWRRTMEDGTIKYYQTLDEAIAGYAKLGEEACNE